jgi:hypothetical protein
MRELPILFSGAMVRALLDGSKTQTRRVVKPQFEREPVDVVDVVPSWDAPTNYDGEVQMNTTHGKPCPYGVPGDRIWVREAWRVGKPHDATRPRDMLPPLVGRGQGVTVLYEAGGARSVGPAGREEPVYPDDAPMPEWAGKLRPSMFMPRAFSRITLEVTNVRVERLQDISEDDARAEGVEKSTDPIHPYAFAYGRLWEELNGKGSWYANPWVWVVEFVRVNQKSASPIETGSST